MLKRAKKIINKKFGYNEKRVLKGIKHSHKNFVWKRKF